MMKHFVLIVLVMLILIPGGKGQSSMNEDQKQAMVEEVRELSDEFWVYNNRTYNASSLERFMVYFAEDVDRSWHTDPALLVGNQVILETRNEVEGFLQEAINSQESMTPEITERYFSVLSADHVLEVNQGEYTVTGLDGQIYGPYQMTNTVVWQKNNGRWNIQHIHQSYAPRSEDMEE
ncbi:MAG: nuclear transport factor 2 family protein [Bacteroidales bacterium]